MELTSIEPDQVTDTFLRILGWRLRRALLDAPEVVALARSQRVPSHGVGMQGVEPPLPLREVPVDDADATYSGLVAWAWHYAEILELEPPVSAAAGWRIANGQLHGFTPTTSAREAKALTIAVTGWLVRNQDAIMALPDALDYAQAVLPELHRMAGRYPVTPRRQKKPEQRAVECPICGATAVLASWFDPDDQHAILIQCDPKLGGCGTGTEALLTAAGTSVRRLEAVADFIDRLERENTTGDLALPEDEADAQMLAAARAHREAAAAETCEECGHLLALHDSWAKFQPHGGCHSRGCTCSLTVRRAV